MNYYLVVEGNVSEKKLYEKWVSYINPDINYVNHISKIQKNNFSIFSGGGYPHYLSIITAAIEDVNCYSQIDKLVIAVDSEDLSYEEKYNEIEAHVTKFKCHAEIKIVIQHYCLETWALGNKVIISKFPHSQRLRNYKEFFNVQINDPALLPSYNEDEMNRSQFAEKYLRCALNEKYKNLTYTKSNPTTLLHPTYFKRVKERYETTNHISSFNDFLLAFI